MAFIGLNTSAQDVIVKQNGDEIQCKILEVSKNEVKYKRWTNQDGPSFAEKKSEIFMIKYENGEKEVVAYESPALTVPSVTPNLSTSVPSEMTLADPTPISNVYLEYTSRGTRKSGIIKWGHMQSDEQAQSILTNDWLDYKTARKEERTGKVLAITGGTLFLGGLLWTVFYIGNYMYYLEDKERYDEEVARYQLEYGYNSDWQSDSYIKLWEERVSSGRKEKNICLCSMLGGFVSGSVLFIVGKTKAKRGHRNATQIVSKHKDEYDKNSEKTSMSKPEFNIGSKGNNLAFTLTF